MGYEQDKYRWCVRMVIAFSVLCVLAALSLSAAPTFQAYTIKVKADRDNGARLTRAILDRYASRDRIVTPKDVSEFVVSLTAEEAAELAKVRK